MLKYAWILVGILFLSALGYGTHRYNRWLFPIQIVDLYGDFRYVDPSSAQKSVLSALEGGFFSLNLQNIADAVEKDPWIKEARVRRIWPARLRVRVTPYEPIATWNEEKLITADGVTFNAQAPGRDFPSLNGPSDQAHDVIAMFKRMENTLAPLNCRVTALSLSPRGAWDMQVNGKILVKLGRRAVIERLEKFARYFPMLGSKNEKVSRVDLRYPNGMAVQWAS